MQNRALITDRPDVTRAAAPQSMEILGRATRYSRPGRAVPVQRGAARANGPHVFGAAAPDAIEIFDRTGSAPLSSRLNAHGSESVLLVLATTSAFRDLKFFNADGVEVLPMP